MNKNFFTLLGTIGLISLYLRSAPLVQAQADALLLRDDGSVVLVLESPVLAASTTKEAPKEEKKPAPPQGTMVTLVSKNTQATVTVHPENEKRMTVTVQTQTPGSNKQNQAPAGNSKEVDKVVVEGSNNSVVVSITPASQKNVTIEQGAVRAQTAIPLQIDSTTHALSASSQQGNSVRVLLPQVVMQSLVAEKLVSAASLTQGQNQPQPNMTLTQKGNDVVYSIVQQRKLFETIPLPPSVVTVSNTTGQSSASIYTRLVGLIFR